MPGGEVGASSGGSGDTRQGRSRLMARRGMLGLVASLAMLAGCGDGGGLIARFEPIRYRLEAQVETPTGVKTGSSVIQVTIDQSLRGSQVRGEAAAVEIAPGQIMFVLLRSPNDVDWAANALNYFPAGEREGTQPSDLDARAAQAKAELDAIRADHGSYPVWVPKDAPATVPRKTPGSPDTPYLVRFRDIADPRTVEQVDPDNLAKSFGPGVRLKSLTVQMTNEPVTAVIEKRLTWIASMEGHDFNKDGPFDKKYPALLIGIRKN